MAWARQPATVRWPGCGMTALRRRRRRCHHRRRRLAVQSHLFVPTQEALPADPLNASCCGCRRNVVPLGGHGVCGELAQRAAVRCLCSMPATSHVEARASAAGLHALGCRSAGPQVSLMGFTSYLFFSK